MAEVRFHDSEDDRREHAVEMFKRHAAKQLGNSSYDPDIEHLEYAVLAFADEWTAELSTALGDLVGRLWRLPEEQRDLVLGTDSTASLTTQETHDA